MPGRRRGRSTHGAPASYIPELVKADPSLCGITIATVDGAIRGIGDWREPLTIQSISKAFVYGDALQVHVLRRVGVEPTGESFNSILITLLGNMAADLDERLQLANAEIRALGS